MDGRFIGRRRTRAAPLLYEPPRRAMRWRRPLGIFGGGACRAVLCGWGLPGRAVCGRGLPGTVYLWIEIFMAGFCGRGFGAAMPCPCGGMGRFAAPCLPPFRGHRAPVRAARAHDAAALSRLIAQTADPPPRMRWPGPPFCETVAAPRRRGSLRPPSAARRGSDGAAYAPFPRRPAAPPLRGYAHDGHARQRRSRSALGEGRRAVADQA